MNQTKRSSLLSLAGLAITIGFVTVGCSSGPPPPTLQNAGSGVAPKQMMDNVENSNMPDFFKKKREKGIQSRMNAGG